MSVVRLKHVNAVRRRGRLYYYHRKTGERLPDEANARALRVLSINESLERAPPDSGTLKALIGQYRASADFTALALRTRQDYDAHLAALDGWLGDLQHATIQRRHVLELRDGLLEELGARQANYRLTVLRRLFSFAVDRGLRGDNPASKFRRFKEGPGHQAWPLEAVRGALAHAKPETAAAILFLLATALRPTDACRAAWSNVHGDTLRIRQSKTGDAVDIPVGQALRRVLAVAPRRATTILCTPTGKTWTQNWLSREIGAAVAAAGYPGHTPHGLRETAASLIAAEGDATIQALLGHRTQAQSAHYRRHAAKKALAEKGVTRLDDALASVGFAKRPRTKVQNARSVNKK